jgi:hypothetical protein
MTARDDEEAGLYHLGYIGMINAGLTPEEAWAEVRETSKDPAVRAIIAVLGETEEGRAALTWSRERWAGHGLTAPWEPAVTAVPLDGPAAIDGSVADPDELLRLILADARRLARLDGRAGQFARRVLALDAALSRDGVLPLSWATPLDRPVADVPLPRRDLP